MVEKRSKAELKRLVETAVAEVCDLPRSGLWFCVDELETSGSPPARIRAWATLHFTAEGSPFCCGEPQCHLGLFGERLALVAEHVRTSMGLRQPVLLELKAISAQHHAANRFQCEPSRRQATNVTTGRSGGTDEPV